MPNARFRVTVKGHDMIELVPYDPVWPSAFAREAARLKDALGDVLQRLEHIGSTAIPGLTAKPVIDILAIASDVALLDTRSQAFETLGYQVRGEFGIPGRRYFRKDDDIGRRTHHIHAFTVGANEITRHLDFRDYLRAHPAVAEEYRALKESLAAKCGDDPPCYSDGKTDFIRDVEQKAAIWRS